MTRLNNEALKDVLAATAVLVITAVVYGLLFNRETTLSYSIGYNLYGAERVLSGEIPYLNFHTLYPPGTVYLNALLFKIIGIGLFSALFGVLLFKIGTILVIYVCSRMAMPRAWSVLTTLSAVLWLRPNGPFKAAPMHYGALFLALALYFTLQGERRESGRCSFAAGLSIGLLALFKHNIGAYALAGIIALQLAPYLMSLYRSSEAKRFNRRLLWVIGGFCLPVLPVILFFWSKGALGAMIRSLLFGSGEFLVSRLAASPSPITPAALVLIATGAIWLGRRMKRAQMPYWSALLLLIVVFAFFGPRSAIDQLIFYGPILVIIAGFALCLTAKEISTERRRMLAAFVIVALASFLEAFPRFAREQAIASIPFVLPALFFQVNLIRNWLERAPGIARSAAIALAIAPVLFACLGIRVFTSSFLAGAAFKSDTPLSIERGRRVYFPENTAREIDDVVSFIKERVPPGGYFFAESYAGSSFLFLADRNNPSGAQFWGGVGVTPTERERTLNAIKDRSVNLIVTSDRDREAEKYRPMRDYIDDNFRETRRFGEVVILERR